MSYAIPDMGLDWAQTVFLPIVAEMREALRATEFVTYRRTAAILCSLLDYNFDRLQRAFEMYQLADEMQQAAATRPKPASKPRKPISEEAWQRALDRTRAEERKAGEMFNGPVFFIPDTDE